MIIVRIMGGPGNQFYQYAFAKRVALNLNTDLYLDLDYDKTIQDSSYGVKYVLDKYNVRAGKASKETVEEIKNRKKQHLFFQKLIKLNGLVGKGLRFLLSQYFSQIYYLQQSHVKDNPKISNRLLSHIYNNSYLDGYWDRRSFFDDILGVLQDDLSIKKDFLTEKYYSYLNEIKNSKNSVSVHIRRGAYETVPEFKKIFGLMPIEYYKKAIEKMENTIGSDFTIFIFSNDLEWAKLNLRFQQKLVFVDAGKDYLENQLMRHCDHNIIANSTFSWWAAYLNSNPDKIVIAPKRWYENENMQKKYEKGDLIPDKWVKL